MKKALVGSYRSFPPVGPYWFGLKLEPRFTNLQSQLKHLYCGNNSGNGNDSINILTHSSPALSNSERAFTKSF
jgi:hypothetical protein